MRSQWFCATLGTLLTVTSMVAQADQPSEQDSPQGVVTYCSGTCIRHRQGNLARLVVGASVQAGDQIESTDEAQSIVVLGSGTVVTLDGYTMVKFHGHSSGWMVDLITGEVRIAHDGKSRLSVRSGGTKVDSGRSVIRIQSRESTYAELLGGEAQFVGPNKSRQPLEFSVLYELAESGVVRAEGRKSWSIETSYIRLASALQTSPELQPPSVAGGGISPSDVPVSDTTPRPLSDPADPLTDPENMLSEIEELDEFDEDEPRVTQPDAVATRGSQTDNARVSAESGVATGTFAGSSSLSLGSLSASTFGFASGGLFADAGQQTLQGTPVFPGSIHLVTAESRYKFDSVQLSASELTGLFGSGSSGFFSIGKGPLPTGQVLTNYLTGSNATLGDMTILKVPRFDIYVVGLDQYGIPDAADPTSGALSSNIGLTGLVGANPTGPVILGATALEDDRATTNTNGGATFALGEFLVSQDGAEGIAFSVRTSDQDRTIVKDPGGDDALDVVTPNTDDVDFTDTTDPRFLPQAPSVKVPTAYDPGGTNVSALSLERRAAFTTLVADRLKEYATRTGQTRFVVDGKIIDIRGYRPNP